MGTKGCDIQHTVPCQFCGDRGLSGCRTREEAKKCSKYNSLKRIANKVAKLLKTASKGLLEEFTEHKV